MQNEGFGYSRDYHEELPQVCLPGITDGESRMPIFTETVSRNKPDVKSFLDVVRQAGLSCRNTRITETP